MKQLKCVPNWHYHHIFSPLLQARIETVQNLSFDSVNCDFAVVTGTTPRRQNVIYV